MRVLYILTASQSATFLKGALGYLRDRGWKIDLCVPELTKGIAELQQETGGEVFVCPMERNISLLEDITSFARLCLILTREQPEVIITIGPKAGLLANMAGFFCGIKTRIQTKWGLRLETSSGFQRQVLFLSEVVSSHSAHATFFDGKSTLDVAVSSGMVTSHKARLVGNGSANGIDAQRFGRSDTNLEKARGFREALGIENDAPVIGYVGRICRDKGLDELVKAWKGVIKSHPNAHLVVVGESECRSAEELGWQSALRNLPNVHLTGPQKNVEWIMPAFDILLVTSHREGFGVVVLEAAATEVPTVAFDVTGIRDSVINGKTGLLCPLGDITTMVGNLSTYLMDSSLRARHGSAGRARALADFDPRYVWSCYHSNILDVVENES